MSEFDDLRLDRTAPRVRRILMPQGRRGKPEASSREAGASEGAGPLESGLEGAGSRGGPPSGRDVQAIAARLMAESLAQGRPMSTAEADGLARTIVANASKALRKLDGAPDGTLGQDEAVALEAVLHVRGRPAVRIMEDNFEDIGAYPESGLWKLLADEHFANVWATAGSTAAVRVTDKLIAGRSWVQGTAFLVGPDLAMTNRHVLFPPNGGVRLARRVPGTTTARLKADYDVMLDFAFDNGRERASAYRIKEVPFVAEDADSVDMALLRVERAGEASDREPEVLALSQADAFDADRLYIVGHPGFLESVPEDIQLVFGRPDERKRVSFGQLMDPETVDQAYIVHDASTIGGYSGAGVFGFDSKLVQALHYWGDSKAGNRAIAASAIRRHPTAGAMIPRANP